MSARLQNSPHASPADSSRQRNRSTSPGPRLVRADRRDMCRAAASASVSRPRPPPSRAYRPAPLPARRRTTPPHAAHQAEAVAADALQRRLVPVRRADPASPPRRRSPPLIVSVVIRHHRPAVIVVAAPRIGEREVVARHVREAAEVDAVGELRRQVEKRLSQPAVTVNASPAAMSDASAATARSPPARPACGASAPRSPAGVRAARQGQPPALEPARRRSPPSPLVVNRRRSFAAVTVPVPRKSGSSRSTPQRQSPRSASQVVAEDAAARLVERRREPADLGAEGAVLARHLADLADAEQVPLRRRRPVDEDDAHLGIVDRARRRGRPASSRSEVSAPDTSSPPTASPVALTSSLASSPLSGS